MRQFKEFISPNDSPEVATCEWCEGGIQCHEDGRYHHQDSGYMMCSVEGRYAEPNTWYEEIAEIF